MGTGGCNALGSLHPHDHCTLIRRVDLPFDHDLPSPAPVPRRKTKKEEKSSARKKKPSFHVPNHPFGCSNCDRRFKYRSSRDKHERVCREGAPALFCSKCGVQYWVLPRLRTHEAKCRRKTPTKRQIERAKRKMATLDARTRGVIPEKRQTCSKCGELYSSKASLKRHREICEGELAFDSLA